MLSPIPAVAQNEGCATDAPFGLHIECVDVPTDGIRYPSDAHPIVIELEVGDETPGETIVTSGKVGISVSLSGVDASDGAQDVEVTYVTVSYDDDDDPATPEVDVLAAEGGTPIRVGDPPQLIYQTGENDAPVYVVGTDGPTYTATELAALLTTAPSDGGDVEGTLNVRNAADFTTAKAHGILVVSSGGDGEEGSCTTVLVATWCRDGADGGDAASVSVSNYGEITVDGRGSFLGLPMHGIAALSSGGDGGEGGGAFGLVYSEAEAGGDGGNGGDVGVTLSTGSKITVHGDGGHGVYARSQGGDGGPGGDDTGGLIAIGDEGGNGGDAGLVVVTNRGLITTHGDHGHGIYAESTGAGAGSGSGTGGFVAVGGNGGGESSGGKVVVNNLGEITTDGSESFGVLAQSIGGGGGDGGGSGGAFAVGGRAGSGGNSDLVTISNSGTISTAGDGSVGVLMQSIGGGGGNGGDAYAFAPVVAVAIGGSGGLGGDGAGVIYNETDDVTRLTGAVIATTGDTAHGLQAQSIGGGGGAGGFALAGAVPVSGLSVVFGLGGTGGPGGDGDDVTVNAKGLVSTEGNSAIGILAQSVGGGGGSGGGSIAASGGGTISVSMTAGGSGGTGGDAGIVAVNTAGTIATDGALAHAILAQSVGGGGGNGGTAVSAALGLISASASLGGDGDKGGDGDAVSVDTYATDESDAILTIGDGAIAILAQSIGGGGGNGGTAGSGSFNGLSLALGGSGEGGGTAGEVAVKNRVAVSTSGLNAAGILAQSVGGGGGNGGMSVGGSVGVAASSVSLGGAAGGGNDSAGVSIDNLGTIFTQGHMSAGIFAQSVGGGGGNGGSAYALSGAFTGEVPAVAVSVALGGSGGSGGDAGIVRIGNAGYIETHGISAHGVLAQSIGGGGGNGGLVGSGVIAIGMNAASFNVAVGGSGGEGGEGGKVVVGRDNSGEGITGDAIVTTGESASGIRAQSIGGGGGNGGLAVAANLNGVVEGTSLSVGVSVGGSGGDGGNGGDVDVFSDQYILTLSDNAEGIFAQSIGGGGGDGGNSVTGLVTVIDTTSTARAINLATTIGGSGGVAGDGAGVTVVNRGTIETGRVVMDGDNPLLDAEGNQVIAGASSHGVSAQSIGGGGGVGGRGNAINLVLGKSCGDECPADPPTSVALSVSVGGDGGASGDGGVVEVDNEGTIVTHGATANGIFAQSVGGGGGAGGNGIIGSGELLPTPVPVDAVIGLTFDKTKKYSNLSVAVGGSGGSSGDGGTVSVANSGGIRTEGSNSTAIFAQSVGGGGGIGGLAGIGALGKVGIGGEGGSAGDGGTVSVALTDEGVIETLGTASHGVFAQSVGGGGGVAGNIDRFLKNGFDDVPALNVGIGLAFQREGGDGGDGGDVTVTADTGTAIVTHGQSATGIFAQSVGGGGGLLGNAGYGAFGEASNFAVGSAGDVGDAGRVMIDYTGTIHTFGENAAGIFAQSDGGATDGLEGGKAGDVMITLDGVVVAEGLGAHGIVATSRADQTNGIVTIALAEDGAIVGGESNDEQTAVGINLTHGRDNSIVNNGLITTLGGVESGYAVFSGDADETVDNAGTVTGSLDLGGGRNRFNNTGTLNSGELALLGSSGSFVSAGRLSPGGDGVVMATQFDSALMQTGTFAIDLDFQLRPLEQADPLQAAEADAVFSTQAMNFGGVVELSILNGGAIVSGERRALLARSDLSLTADALELDAPESAIARYELETTDTELILSYGVDFTPEGLNANQASVGDHIDAMQTAFSRGEGDTEQMRPITDALFGLPDLLAYSAALDSLSAELYAANQVTTLLGALDFENAMLSCRVFDGAYKFNREGECLWVAVGGASTEQQDSATSGGFATTTSKVRVGAQFSPSVDLAGNFGMSYERTSTSIGASSQSSGERLQLGAALKQTIGGTTLAGIVSGGMDWNQVTRAVALPGDVGYLLEGQQELMYVGAHARVSHTFGQDSAYLRPYVDLGVMQVHSEGFTEDGGPVALEVAPSTHTFVTATAAVEVGGEIALGDTSSLRPFGSVGVVTTHGDVNPWVTARFVGAPDSVDGFESRAAMDPTMLDVNLGFDLLSNQGVVFRASAGALIGETTLSYGGNLKFSLPF
ncbi:hypothetical protein [Devosia sp.]|uniref:hypothetical protein n=1 Tax=Devosia sp. TaxID=1871048 RepID=UPI003A91FE28